MKAINIILIALVWSVLVAFPTETEAQRSGSEIWSQTCGNCHRSQPTSQYDARHWKTISAHMTIYARLTDDEAILVKEFLINGARQMSMSPVNSPDVMLKDPKQITSVELTGEETKVLKEFIKAKKIN